MLRQMLRWAWGVLGAIDIAVGLGLAAIITALTIALVGEVADLNLGWKIALFLGLGVIMAVSARFTIWLFGPRVAAWRSAAAQPSAVTDGGRPSAQGSIVIQQGPQSTVIQQGVLVGQEGQSAGNNSGARPPANPPGMPSSEKPWIHPDQHQDQKFSQQRVRLVDIVDRNFRIEGRDFEDCDIEGPGVVALLGRTALLNSSFDGEQDSVFWEVPEGKTVVGAIAVANCTFKRCRFHGIGVAGTAEQIANYLKGFSGGSDTSASEEDSQPQ